MKGVGSVMSSTDCFKWRAACWRLVEKVWRGRERRLVSESLVASSEEASPSAVSGTRFGNSLGKKRSAMFRTPLATLLERAKVTTNN